MYGYKNQTPESFKCLCLFSRVNSRGFSPRACDHRSLALIMEPGMGSSLPLGGLQSESSYLSVLNLIFFFFTLRQGLTVSWPSLHSAGWLYWWVPANSLWFRIIWIEGTWGSQKDVIFSFLIEEELETTGIGIKGHPWLQSQFEKFESILNCMKLCLKNLEKIFKKLNLLTSLNVLNTDLCTLQWLIFNSSLQSHK